MGGTEGRERSGQQDEWLAKMFECDHELDLSHNLKKAVTQSSQLESESKSKAAKGAQHTRHVKQPSRAEGTAAGALRY